MAERTLTMEAPHTGAGGRDTGGVDAARSDVLAHRRSPARDLVDEMRAGSSRQVRLREIAFLTQVAIRASSGSRAAHALASALGTGLPTGVGEVSGAADGR